MLNLSTICNLALNGFTIVFRGPQMVTINMKVVYLVLPVLSTTIGEVVTIGGQTITVLVAGPSGLASNFLNQSISRQSPSSSISTYFIWI